MLYLQRENKMWFCTILVAMAPLCLANTFGAEEVMAMFETLQVGHIRKVVKLANLTVND